MHPCASFVLSLVPCSMPPVPLCPCASVCSPLCPAPWLRTHPLSVPGFAQVPHGRLCLRTGLRPQVAPSPLCALVHPVLPFLYPSVVLWLCRELGKGKHPQSYNKEHGFDLHHHGCGFIAVRVIAKHPVDTECEHENVEPPEIKAGNSVVRGLHGMHPTTVGAQGIPCSLAVPRAQGIPCSPAVPTCCLAPQATPHASSMWTQTSQCGRLPPVPRVHPCSAPHWPCLLYASPQQRYQAHAARDCICSACLAFTMA